MGHPLAGVRHPVPAVETGVPVVEGTHAQVPVEPPRQGNSGGTTVASTQQVQATKKYLNKMIGDGGKSYLLIGKLDTDVK